MVVLEVLAFALMLFTLWRAGRYALDGLRGGLGGAGRAMVLPVLLYLTVSAMLFFAAFGGESHLVTDWRTMLTRGVAGLAVVAVVAGYFTLVRKARERAARDADGGGA